MTDHKKILIICYSFPPYPGTGGRRWAKFSKYLSRNGCEVYAIGAKNLSAGVSHWEKDIDGKNIKSFYIHSFYPQLSGKFSKKIAHFFYSKPIKLFSNKNFLDPSIYWGKRILPAAIRLVKKYGIENIIVSAPPFGYLDELIVLKKRFKNINLILDVRDSKQFYIKGLDRNRIAVEGQKEKRNIAHYNTILTVSDYMTSYYKEMCNDTTNVLTLLNGYDPEDFSYLKTQNKFERNPAKIKFVYAGQLIEECYPYVNAFFKALLYLREKDNKLYQKIEVMIFGNKETKAYSFCENNNLDCVTFYGQTAQEKVLQHTCLADFCLIFPADFYAAFSLESKFFEYCYLRKPIVVFPENGTCSETVKTYNLGYAISVENAQDELLTMLKEYINGSFIYNNNFDIEKYSVPFLTKQLEKLLKSKNAE